MLSGERNETGKHATVACLDGDMSAMTARLLVSVTTRDLYGTHYTSPPSAAGAVMPNPEITPLSAAPDVNKMKNGGKRKDKEIKEKPLSFCE
jgi:hypothetical protein